MVKGVVCEVGWKVVSIKMNGFEAIDGGSIVTTVDVDCNYQSF